MTAKEIEAQTGCDQLKHTQLQLVFEDLADSGTHPLHTHSALTVLPQASALQPKGLPGTASMVQPPKSLRASVTWNWFFFTPLFSLRLTIPIRDLRASNG